MAITTTSQTIEITDITSVIVTPVQQDPINGDFVREIRLFGTVVGAGSIGPEVFVLRLHGLDGNFLKIASPPSEF